MVHKILLGHHRWPNLQETVTHMGPWSPAFYLSSQFCTRSWLPWVHEPEHSARLAESAQCTKNYGPFRENIRGVPTGMDLIIFHPLKVWSLYRMIPSFLCQTVVSPHPHMFSCYGAWQIFTFTDMVFCHQSSHLSHSKC